MDGPTWLCRGRVWGGNPTEHEQIVPRPVKDFSWSFKGGELEI